MSIFLTKANRFAFLLARTIAINYSSHQNKLRHDWTGLAACEAVNHLYLSSSHLMLAVLV